MKCHHYNTHTYAKWWFIQFIFIFSGLCHSYFFFSQENIEDRSFFYSHMSIEHIKNIFCLFYLPVIRCKASTTATRNSKWENTQKKQKKIKRETMEKHRYYTLLLLAAYDMHIHLDFVHFLFQEITYYMAEFALCHFYKCYPCTYRNREKTSKKENRAWIHTLTNNKKKWIKHE